MINHAQVSTGDNFNVSSSLIHCKWGEIAMKWWMERVQVQLMLSLCLSQRRRQGSLSVPGSPSKHAFPSSSILAGSPPKLAQRGEKVKTFKEPILS